DALNVKLHLEHEITGIDRHVRCVTDKHGKKHHYDKLIHATRSRALVPKEAPIDFPGVFTMRTRQDADRLKSFLKPDGHVLIIGGGLLGLELAASLREIDINISIVQLGGRLMERQIDILAGQLLIDLVE